MNFGTILLYNGNYSVDYRLCFDNKRLHKVTEYFPLVKAAVLCFGKLYYVGASVFAWNDSASPF